MSDSNQRWLDLTRIAQLVADQAIADVAQAQTEFDRIQSNVAAIKAHRVRLNQSVGDPIQAAFLARHSEGLRRSLAQAISLSAQRAAILEEAKLTARPALGRRMALEKLLASVKKPR